MNDEQLKILELYCTDKGLLEEVLDEKKEQ